MTRHYFERQAVARGTQHLLCLLPLLTASLLSSCATGPGSGDGKVIDFVSKEPIPQAAVELTCTLPKRWHGSDKKILKTESASDGSYHFDRAGLENCDFFFANAVKAGYGLDHMTEALTNPGPETARQIPKIVYLIKKSDQPMVLLERLADFMPVDPPVAGPAAPSAFGAVYKQFIASRGIAATPAMAVWIRAHYCARLQAGWDVLSDRQRAELRSDHTSQVDWAPIALRPDSFAKEVRPYCSG